LSAATAVTTHTKVTAALPRPGILWTLTIGRFSVILAIGMSNEPDEPNEVTQVPMTPATDSIQRQGTTIIGDGNYKSGTIVDLAVPDNPPPPPQE
jgi:hypothetical protein